MRLLRRLLFTRRGPRFSGFDAAFLDARVYHQFTNIIIPTSRGSTEIDHLIVSRFGLFVIELKDRSGWIFADANDKTWTAVQYDKKYPFENPLRQNFGHAKALEELLRIGRDKMHEAVVFRGDFEFKTPVPAGVICGEYASWVVSKATPLLRDEEVRKIVAQLGEVASVGHTAMNVHIDSLRQRLSSNTICPKCGAGLVTRIARRGLEPGSRFLGCSNYPTCKFTRDAT